jgi:hypothetical protein
LIQQNKKPIILLILFTKTGDTMKTNIQSIKTEQEKRHTELFRSCHLFWAFSNEQFAEGAKANPLQPGEKYVSIGHGGYLPKSQLDNFLNGMEAISKWYKAEVKAAKQGDAEILYELSNHECWYTGDISDAIPALPNYTREHIQRVYNNNRVAYQADL